MNFRIYGPIRLGMDPKDRSWRVQPFDNLSARKYRRVLNYSAWYLVSHSRPATWQTRLVSEKLNTSRHWTNICYLSSPSVLNVFRSVVKSCGNTLFHPFRGSLESLWRGLFNNTFKTTETKGFEWMVGIQTLLKSGTLRSKGPFKTAILQPYQLT